jgi:Flp pilus assembly protein CpaB
LLIEIPQQSAITNRKSTMKAKSPSILPVILIAALAGGLTLFFLFSLRADTEVVVADRPVGVGARLTAEDLTIKKVRSADALPNAIKTIEEAVNQVISVQRLPGDQITSDMLGSEAFSAIAAGLAPDHRAVAVNVTRSSGLAGIVRPGDRVTLIAIVTPPTTNSPLSASGPTLLAPTPIDPFAAIPFAVTPTATSSAIKPYTPFSRITANGLKVLLVPQTFRYEEATTTDAQGFALAQSSQVGQSEGVIVLDVPATPVTVQGIDGPTSLSLPELIALLDTQAEVYLALEPPLSQIVDAPGVAIEQLVDLGVGEAQATQEVLP